MEYSNLMNPYQTRSIKEMREQLSQLVEEVAIAKKRYLITKFGKPKAMMIPLDSLTRVRKKKNLAGFGMWKNRKDIKDSAKWVRKQRQKMSSRYGKIFG